jgi:SAM-dependent methyltransferase
MRHERIRTKREIKRSIIREAFEGQLFNVEDDAQLDRFRGSVDRFSEIAFRFQDRPRVLDVGSEGGILLSILNAWGHEGHAVDIADSAARYPDVYREKGIRFAQCNVEVDPIPYPDDYFDAVSCCQCLEHFTHSHLPAMKEFRRVLKPGGILEVDVPNAVCFRNRSRMLRGKHITFDYVEHYLEAEPVLYKGMSFYPLRHNREFTLQELRRLFELSGFKKIEVSYLKSRRLRTGLERIRTIGTIIRDLVPSIRKSLIGFGYKT